MPEMNREKLVDKIVLQQYYRLKKISSPDSVIMSIPEELRKYAGNYQFSPARLSLDISFYDDTLTTNDPLKKSGKMLSYTKKGNNWTDKTGMFEIGFISSEEEVSALNLTVNLEFRRGAPVTEAMEPVIKKSGIAAGLKKYDEIKKSGNKEYLFSENMLHQLGHQFLSEEKNDDAIKIFEKNVKEYPRSFLANDALAETYLKNGETKPALKYFKATVKLNPEYEYGKKKIDEISNKQ
jgi:tetratricopeptide (TPR) repeat protein